MAEVPLFSSGRWGTDDVNRTEKKVVMIYENGCFTESAGKSLYLEPSWTIGDFLFAASQRLGMTTAMRVFSSDGESIDDCMMIEDNDILFISKQEDYIPPTAPPQIEGSPTQTSRKGRDEGMPSMIGGFFVGKFLGRGGFGEVRYGEHQVTGEKVALKFLRKADLLTMGAAERTATEIQCLVTLKHPNIIRLQHHTESVNHVVLVFEVMEGGDLYHYLTARGRTPAEVALPEDQARLLFQQLISAVSYAHHQHICHRDLKLENVLLKGGDLSLVKIADFGLSSFFRPGSVMRSSCGTLSFQAPETFKTSASPGTALDVWSLGVILFAVLCGRLPFEGSDVIGVNRPRDAVIRSKILKGQYRIVENLSIEAKDLIRCMLALNPNERASMPDVYSHCWLMSHSLSLDPAGPSSSSSSSSLGHHRPSMHRLSMSSKTDSEVSADFSPPPGPDDRGGLGLGDGSSSNPVTPRAASASASASSSSAATAESSSSPSEDLGSSPSFKLFPLRRTASKAEVDVTLLASSPPAPVSSPIFRDARDEGGSSKGRASLRSSLSTSPVGGLGAYRHRDSIDDALERDSRPLPPVSSSSSSPLTGLSRKSMSAKSLRTDWDPSTTTSGGASSSSCSSNSNSTSNTGSDRLPRSQQSDRVRGASTGAAQSSSAGRGVISALTKSVARAFHLEKKL